MEFFIVGERVWLTTGQILTVTKAAGEWAEAVDADGATWDVNQSEVDAWVFDIERGGKIHTVTVPVA